MKKLREHEPPHRQQHQQPGGKLGRSGSRSAQRSTRQRSTWSGKESWKWNVQLLCLEKSLNFEWPIAVLASTLLSVPEVQQQPGCTPHKREQRRRRRWPRWRRTIEPGGQTSYFWAFIAVEQAFNVELWASHAKCKMGGNGVAAFFGTIGKSGSTQQCNTKSWNWQRLILKKKIQSILTKFGSSFILAILG